MLLKKRSQISMREIMGSGKARIKFNYFQGSNNNMKQVYQQKHQDLRLKLFLKRLHMSSLSSSTSIKSSKPISKGNRSWRKVNKLAHRLRSKGVPSSIVELIDNAASTTPAFINSLDFEPMINVEQIRALSKIQAIQVLNLRMGFQMETSLQRKQTKTTEIMGEDSQKQNLWTEQYSSEQAQQAVFQ